MNEGTAPAPEKTSKFTPKRSKPQRAADMALIAKLALQSHTEHEITAALNSQRDYQLSRSAIHADLAQLRRQWESDAAQDTAALFATELAKLNNLERTYWESFNSSPSPRWLDGIAKVISARISLLGLNKPTTQRLEFAGLDGGPMAILEMPAKKYPDRNA